MDSVVLASQILIALGIFNVWLVRPRKATEWRGGTAHNLKEEFAAYGLPGWFMAAVGCLKLLCALLLIVGIWVPVVTQPAAIALALLMLGAVTMHFKVKDPVQRSLPAFAMLGLCLLVAFL